MGRRAIKRTGPKLTPKSANLKDEEELAPEEESKSETGENLENSNKRKKGTNVSGSKKRATTQRVGTRSNTADRSKTTPTTAPKSLQFDQPKGM